MNLDYGTVLFMIMIAGFVLGVFIAILLKDHV